MFKRVVVGVDGNVGGRDAIALAQQLIDSGGELTLANVWSPDGIELLERERAAANVDAHLRSVDGDSVGAALHELADSSHADLVVVGSSRRGLVERVFLGGVTMAALHNAGCPVAVAPTSHARRSHPIREIGVGYNGSPESERALVAGRRLAAEVGAKLSVFEVISLPPRDSMAEYYNLRAAIPRAVRRAEERLGKLGGVEPHAVYGIPTEELALYSGSVDLLVVGSRDHAPPGRLRMGSTSVSLVRSVRCPLLVLAHASVRDELGLDQPVVERVAHELSA
jgi:nucleotide-binding universal stress UspA family protein